MHDLHDRVTFTKNDTIITGKIIDIYYNLEKEVMVVVKTDDKKHHILKMAELNK